MTATPHDHDDQDSFEDDLDDETTLAAAPDALKDIRARTADRSFDPSDDVTSVMAGADADLVEDPTVIRTFDPANDVTVVESFATDDHTELTGGFDPSDDPTTVMSTDLAAEEAQVTDLANQAATSIRQPRAPAAVVPKAPPTEGSLISGKAAPVSSSTYWDKGEIVTGDGPTKPAAKGPVPVWFIVTSLMAVIMAVGLVLLVLWALSGTTA